MAEGLSSKHLVFPPGRRQLSSRTTAALKAAVLFLRPLFGAPSMPRLLRRSSSTAARASTSNSSIFIRRASGRAQRRALFEHHPSSRRRVANKSVSDIRGHESRSRVPDTHCAENPPPRICRLPSPASLSPFRESKSHTALRAPPWAFTLHRVCSHHPRNVSAHALSSPRGIGILAPAPRCDPGAGGRRTRRIPPHTLATHGVPTRHGLLRPHLRNRGAPPPRGAGAYRASAPAPRAAPERWGFLYDLVGFPIRYVS